MIFKFLLMIGTLYLFVINGFCNPLPDSAGIVPQSNGLSYGGIPYGSISGQLSLYFGDYEPIILSNKVTGDDVQLL